MNEAITAFYKVRGVRGIHKKPSTSELLDWIKAIQVSSTDVNKIQSEIPMAGVLLKKNEDLDILKKNIK